MSDLLKKLNEVLENDKAAEKEAAAAVAQQDDEEDAIRKVKKAEEQVAFLQDLFHNFVSDSIMLEYPNLFTADRLAYRQIARQRELFGDLRPSAEHRAVAVTFKKDFLLHVRFSAVILSRELEVTAYFSRRGQDEKAKEVPVDLLQFREGPRVDWKSAFEWIFMQFLGWYEKR